MIKILANIPKLFFYIALLIMIGCVVPPRKTISPPAVPQMPPEELKRLNAEAYCAQRNNYCQAILSPAGKRYNYAVELYEKNDLETSHEILKSNIGSISETNLSAILGIEPDNSYSPSLNLAGVIFWRLNNRDAARSYFIQAAKLDDPDAKLNLDKIRLQETPILFSYRKKALKTAESIFKGYSAGSDLSVDVHIK